MNVGVVETSHRDSQRGVSLGVHLFELTPVLATLVVLTYKQIRFSLTLDDLGIISAVERSNAVLFTATLASVLLPVGFITLLPRVARYVGLLFLNVSLSTLILADTISERFYQEILSTMSITPWDMVREVLPSIRAQLTAADVILYLDIITGAIILPLYVRKARSLPLLRLVHLRSIALCCVALACVLLVPLGRLLAATDRDLFVYTNMHHQMPSTIGLVPYHLWDLSMRLNRRERTVSQESIDRVADFVRRGSRTSAQSPSPLFGAAKGRNLILISAESLNAFAMGLRLNGQPVTPHLDAFAKESLHFVSFYDQTHLGTTSDGEFISLNSLHPSPVGTVVFNWPDNQYYGLPAILSKVGYNTLAAAGEPGSFWDMQNAHKRYGIGYSYFEETYATRERIGSWLADKPFFEETVRFLQLQREPFMAFVLSSSNHHPFLLPEKYQELNLGSLDKTNIGRYLQSVHYLDGAFGAFLDSMRASGLLQRTVVAVYGDHEGFMSHEAELPEVLGTPLGSMYEHFKVQKRVPFMVRLPNGELAQTVDTVGGHTDIAPTLLALLGIRDKDSIMFGRDLMGQDRRFVVFRDGSFIDEEHLLINRYGPIAGCVCFEVKTGRRIDCQPLSSDRDRALERLEMSDLILDGNLVTRLPALVH